MIFSSLYPAIWTINRFIVSFKQTLGCLRKTPTSESLVKSHNNVCNAKTRFTQNQVFHLIGWFRHISKTVYTIKKLFRLAQTIISYQGSKNRIDPSKVRWRDNICIRWVAMELKLKTNKRRLAVTVIIVTLYQTLAHRSFTETAECLVERDEPVHSFFYYCTPKTF